MVFTQSSAARSGVSPSNRSHGEKSPMNNTPRRFNIELGKGGKNKKMKKADNAEDFHSALFNDAQNNLGEVDIVDSFMKLQRVRGGLE